MSYLISGVRKIVSLHGKKNPNFFAIYRNLLQMDEIEKCERKLTMIIENNMTILLELRGSKASLNVTLYYEY